MNGLVRDKDIKGSCNKITTRSQAQKLKTVCRGKKQIADDNS